MDEALTCEAVLDAKLRNRIEDTRGEIYAQFDVGVSGEKLQCASLSSVS